MASASPPDTILSRLIGNPMTVVTFVQDYLQLEFDHHRLTINVWPTVVLPEKEFRIDELGYRDKLCSLIGSTVSSIAVTKSYIEVGFGDRSLLIDLTEDVAAERLVYDDTRTNEWEWW